MYDLLTNIVNFQLPTEIRIIMFTLAVTFLIMIAIGHHYDKKDKDNNDDIYF